MRSQYHHAILRHRHYNLGGIIKLTRFWHHRASEAIIFIAGTITALFAWTEFGGKNSFNYALIVPLIPGIFATITAIITLAAYFVAPLHRLKQSLLISYGLLTITLVSLVMSTNGTSSPFLSLFILDLIFSAFFGVLGVSIGSLTLAALILQQYTSHTVDNGQLIALALLGGAPIIASLLIWSRTASTKEDTAEDRSYSELASELSAVAGKSEVVISTIGDGVLALDGQGVIQLINPAAQRLIGWGNHDAVKLSYKSVLKIINSKNQDVDEANDPVAQALTTNKAVKNDNFSIQTQSGKSFYASISVTPVGQLGSGVIVVFRDITDERSDERQRAEFISTASHEMRTPVASIEGYLGLALNPATASIDEKARDFITKAHESAQHLGRLFTDLLDVSKADDSRLKNDPKIIDVVPFVHDIVEGLTPKAVEKGLRVLYKPLPDNPAKPQRDRDSTRTISPVFYAYVDNDHFREIVQNLVENAIKYTLKGDVIVDVMGDQEHITISITDSGIGIPKEDQTHLFQKFYRVDNSDTREIGGTGLGLYLCRRLTETIGGRIWLESEYKRGSTFFVAIPRTDHDEAQRLIEKASIEAERQDGTQAAATIAPQQQVITPQITAPVAPQPQSIPIPPAQPNSYSIPQLVTPTQTPELIRENQQITAQPPHVPPQISTTPSPNTPISAIEANPRDYLSERQYRGISVPPRQ